MHGGGVAHTDHFPASLRILRTSGQDFAGPEFDEQIATAPEKILHAIGPTHRAGNLLSQAVRISGKVLPVRRDIAQDRETRSCRPRVEQGLAELFNKRYS